MRTEEEIRKRLKQLMEKRYRLGTIAGYEICVWSNGFIAGLMWVLGEG